MQQLKVEGQELMTRNMANTAKVIADNPVLMRLKELETMKEIAGQIDELKLVLGGETLMKALINPTLNP